MKSRLQLLSLCLLTTTSVFAAPPLPAGPKPSLGEPALPEGLEAPQAGRTSADRSATSEPALPAGLGQARQAGMSPAAEGPAGRYLDWSGFLEMRGGLRTGSDPLQRQTALAETRLQIGLEGGGDQLIFQLTGDVLHDEVETQKSLDLETGKGRVDLREAGISWRASERVDVKIGRQTLSWGTGDLLFINDLFPKDFPSFFTGRDQEYLKAPSDAAKISLFLDGLNLDLVYTPRFDADRYIDGSRLSYYNANLGRRAGRDAVIPVERPGGNELAARIYGNLDAYELAAYAYRGFWKSPGGYDAHKGVYTFPALSVYGFSARGPVMGGIGNLESGYYRSGDDPKGDDPQLPNSELRLLLGFERELAPEFTLGIQYQVDRMSDYAAYRLALPPNAVVRDHDRHITTLRLTRLLLNQDLNLSLFAFYSPSDNDGYLRPKAHYKVNDQLSAEVGANIFFGEKEDSFFAQFENNNNLYIGLRYSFASGL